MYKNIDWFMKKYFDMLNCKSWDIDDFEGKHFFSDIISWTGCIIIYEFALSWKVLNEGSLKIKKKK